MQMTTAYSIHNRGSFQAHDTALKSGDSNRDRQSSGESYVPFQQGDQVQFAAQTAAWQADSAPTGGLGQTFERLFNLDLRLISSAIATLIFAVIFQALFIMPLVTAVAAVLFFMVWYIMSFFDFQRVLYNAQHGPRQMRHSHHQVHATF